MAGNANKFIDRSPIICAAGLPTGNPDGLTVESTLKEYPLVDEITAIKHDAKIWRENEFKLPLPLPPIQNPSFNGLCTEIRPIMNPPVETRYQTLIRDLKETTYDSYWNKLVGHTRDEVPGLPAGMKSKEVTFGIPTVSDMPLRYIVNPQKTPYEVLWESQIGHEMYKRTHQDYNPGEKICRGYKSPPFEPEKGFGFKTKYDPRGIWVRCCCDWHIKEPVVHGSKIQADYLSRVRPQIGKVLAPNNNIQCVPKGHIFGGKSERAMFGVEELLKDPNCPPCIFKRDFYKWVSSLNVTKQKMKNRANNDFNFDDFYKRALYFDKEKTGLLPINILYELFSCHRITFPKEDIEALLKFLGIIVEDQIYYKAFIDLLNVNSRPLELQHFNDIPKESMYYVTTYQASSCDYLIINNSALPTAGVPSIRTDLPRPVVPPGGIRADLENLGEESSTKALINPSIYTTYGLSYRDFFMPRSPETIKKLFEKIGYTFPGQTFDLLWKEGLQRDQTGSVCVDTFKILLDTYFSPRKLAVDEAECEKIH